ncbi:microtubule-associated protein 9-like isoform X2 [Mya arenaria]|uniref:microtubule-associated protein 9-like isoform X2 n=1 Tax=Mya arenaria TaxID=6604 RepID=UPI0022DF774A|nr:microtubule-associated protein 9-like isoform X2 [Mya arenaria]XP_052773303.1 microtubule-associated protein 9-like isoform X2 [Mya arenaria]
MDTIDAPVYSATTKRQRQQLPKTSLQQELQAKMRERKKLGLSADITSEESEGLDSDEENSWKMEYRARQQGRPERPTSAKRRAKPDLGDTLRPGEANRFLKSSKKDTKSTLRETPPLKESPRFSKESNRDVDRMFGTLGGSPKGRTTPSPLDSKFGMDTVDAPVYSSKHRKSPAEEGLFSRNSPVSPGPGGLPKTIPSGKHSPAPGKQSPVTRELTAEEKIFGVRQSPTRESPKEKEWKAPNFRQSPVPGQDRASPSSDFLKGGRKTPDSSLMPINESPRPVPRGRHGAPTQETRLRSRESSPRSLSLESPGRSERPKPKVDIFGRKERKIEFEEDKTEKTTSSRERRRFTKDDKSAGQKSITGRKTPTGRETPTGTGRKSPFSTGRQTPTSGKKSSGLDMKDEQKPKKEPGLFDFLQDDADDKKDKTSGSKQRPRPRAERPVERRGVGMKKSVSHDSITGELAAGDQPSIMEESSRDDRIPMDQSSVCAELDEDPDRRIVREKEREQKLLGPSKQRSDRREADDIISRVEDAQTDPKQLTTQRSASAKTNEKVVKPKPRHTLPGTRPSSAATSQDSEMFNSTMSIRQTIFEEWRRARDKEIKQKEAEKKKKEEEEKKKKEKEKLDKLQENKLSYEAWMKERGISFVKEQRKKQHEEEKKKHEEEKEKLSKKKDAKKDFEIWKETKDEKLIDEHKKAIEKKHRQKQAEREKKLEKEKDNESAFKKWKERKDKIIEANKEKEHEQKSQTAKQVVMTQKQKERQAMKDYNEWLQKKETQQQKDALRQRRHSDDYYDDFKPAWSPAGKLIPCGR